MSKFEIAQINFFTNMAKFVDVEAIDEDLESVDSDDTDDNADNDGNVSDNFINDEGMFNESVEDNYRFDNVTRNAQEALNDMLLFDYKSQEANNYYREDFNIRNEKVVEFQDSQKKLMISKKTLVAPYKLPSVDSFYYSLCFAIRYIVSNKKK